MLQKHLPRARSEKDITRASEALSTGSIPVGRANVPAYLVFSPSTVPVLPLFAQFAAAEHRLVTGRPLITDVTSVMLLFMAMLVLACSAIAFTNSSRQIKRPIEAVQDGAAIYAAAAQEFRKLR